MASVMTRLQITRTLRPQEGDRWRLGLLAHSHSVAAQRDPRDAHRIQDRARQQAIFMSCVTGICYLYLCITLFLLASHI